MPGKKYTGEPYSPEELELIRNQDFLTRIANIRQSKVATRMNEGELSDAVEELSKIKIKAELEKLEETSNPKLAEIRAEREKNKQMGQIFDREKAERDTEIANIRDLVAQNRDLNDSVYGEFIKNNIRKREAASIAEVKSQLEKEPENKKTAELRKIKDAIKGKISLVPDRGGTPASDPGSVSPVLQSTSPRGFKKQEKGL